MLSVQLPIIVIHMVSTSPDCFAFHLTHEQNSLDVLPNSVAQVAAAIEEKRSHHRSHRRTESHVSTQTVQASPARGTVATQTRPSRLQGRAFAAPRQQSLERMRASEADLRRIEETLESSPRKHQLKRRPTNPKQPQRSKSVGKENAKTANTRIVSRPAREVHKQPGNLSTGGISVGSYTMFNQTYYDSGSSSNANGPMEYITPPSKRKQRFFASPLRGEGKESVGSGLKHVCSVDSLRSHRSATDKWRDHPGKGKETPPRPPRPPPHPLLVNKPGPPLQHLSAPYALGLSNRAPPRPSRSSFDEGIRNDMDEETKPPDKSRFEFKAVGKKSSAVGLKGWLGGKLNWPNN